MTGRGEHGDPRLIRSLLAGLLCLLLMVGGCSSLSRGRTGPPAPPAPGSPGLAHQGSPLQEVAPPGAASQLQRALEGRHPRVEILAPRDQALMPPGPWTLQLEVKDWPLVDAGPLGLGPHLVVQLDRQPPLPITGTTLSLPPLSPGSHRLTVYAALPWGEAVKSPGASQQIRLHRVAADPLALPEPDQPQLVSVSPLEPNQSEPVLLDWLLLNAPLQHLHEGDIRWRLRVSVNGNSVLVDRPRALWLSGWRPGSNALLLELLDGQGEPLAPPYNSQVAEVVISPQAKRQPWRQERLAPDQLAALLGQPPAAASAEPSAASAAESAMGTAAETAVETAVEPTVEPAVETTAETTASPSPPPTVSAAASEGVSPAVPQPPPSADPPTTANAIPDPSSDSKPPSQSNNGATAEPANGPHTGLEAAPQSQPMPAALPRAAEPIALPSTLEKSAAPARSLVNPDGTLIREPADGPFARLRQRLGR